MDKLSPNKLSDQETQNEIVGPYLENATITHTRTSTEMDTHGEKIKGSPQDYMEKIYYSRTVLYESDFWGSSSDRSRP